MADSKTSEAARKYLATIGAKGGKTVTAAKRAHLGKIAAKGGKTVTPKKLAHLRAMTAARVAKQQQAKAS
jgi:hypothetical protein